MSVSVQEDIHRKTPTHGKTSYSGTISCYSGIWLDGPTYAKGCYRQETKAHIFDIILKTLHSFLKANPHIEQIHEFIEHWQVKRESFLEYMYSEGGRCEQPCYDPKKSSCSSVCSLPSSDIHNDFGQYGPKVVDAAMKIAPVLLACVDPGAKFTITDTQKAIYAAQTYANGHAREACSAPLVMNHVLSDEAEAFICLYDQAPEMWSTLCLEWELQYAVICYSQARLAPDPLYGYGFNFSTGSGDCRAHCLRAAQDNHLNDLILGSCTKNQYKIWLWENRTVISWSIEKHTFPNAEYYDIIEKGMKFATAAWNKVMTSSRVIFKKAECGTVPVIKVVWSSSQQKGVLAHCTTPQGLIETGDDKLRIYEALLDKSFRSQVANILAHELGYLLGFRHSFALTKKDQLDYKAGIVGTSVCHKSIMSYNYPQYFSLSDVSDSRWAYDILDTGKTVNLVTAGGHKIGFDCERVKVFTPGY